MGNLCRSNGTPSIPTKPPTSVGGFLFLWYSETMVKPANLPLEQEFLDSLRARGYTVTRPVSPKRPRHQKAGLLITASGRLLDPMTPDPASVSIEDIAHGLAHVCRFSGQTRTHWSVAQHSICVASLVSPALARHALLHDAAEAYLQDIPAPIKPLIPQYANIESGMMQAIYEAFGLRPLQAHEKHAIKHADRQTCHAELTHLFPTLAGNRLRADLPAPPDGWRFPDPLPADEAREAFLTAWAQAA